jgi:hypothetical protein
MWDANSCEGLCHVRCRLMQRSKSCGMQTHVKVLVMQDADSCIGLSHVGCRLLWRSMSCGMQTHAKVQVMWDADSCIGPSDVRCRLMQRYKSWGMHTHLRYLCLFVYSGVQHILCCVFDLFFFVLYTLCCQFLWFVLFWLPHRYSLAFIESLYLFQILIWEKFLMLCFIIKKKVQLQQFMRTRKTVS